MSLPDPRRLLAALALVPTTAMLSFARERLTERALDDVATLSVPRRLKGPLGKGGPYVEPSRLAWVFESTYLWASMGSGTAYKQQLFVSLMAPDASERDYTTFPHRYSLRYDHVKPVRSIAIGTGTLEIREGIYGQNALEEPAHLLLYRDRARRLQLVWHGVKKEIALDDMVEAVGRMAPTFRIVRDPSREIADERDRPRREAEEGARKVALARATLARLGLGDLRSGLPVERDGVWYEWSDDPEPRLQLLKAMGRVKATPDVMGGMRPRPATIRNADGAIRELPGSIGWYEYWEDEWRFMNGDNAYLPFTGNAERLTKGKDPAWVVFYYAATLRLEHTDESRVTSFDWFTASIPEVERLWREGKLVRGAIDEAPFPLPAR